MSNSCRATYYTALEGEVLSVHLLLRLKVSLQVRLLAYRKTDASFFAHHLPSLCATRQDFEDAGVISRYVGTRRT